MESVNLNIYIILGGCWSCTYRNSKSVPFHCRQDILHKEVRMIQEHCAPAMKYWGYVRAANATHQKEFNPLESFSLV